MPTGLVDRLASVPALVGAALSLGAEGVRTLSEVERDLVRAVAWTPLRRADEDDVRALIASGQDVLGDAFCRLRSPTERRVDGATYTPAPIIEAMVRWAGAGTSPARIIDPGAGTGRFAIAAADQFPEADVIAVELDPLAALLARANVAARGLAGRAEVVLSDYRAFKLPRVEGGSLFIGNPPYVRHHQIAPRWKRWLAATAKERDLPASQLAGLHVHFFLATAEKAVAGDRGAFITSAEWLDVNYGALVRKLALGELGATSLHVLEPELKPFEDADTTAAITCFDVGSKPETIRVERNKTVETLGELGGGQPLHRERFAEATRWTPLTRAARKVPAGYIELGELCRVHRGAVTGANRVWVVDPAATELPESVLFRSVTRARELFAAGTALEDPAVLRCVVDIPTELDELPADERAAVEVFLKAARKEGVHHGYVARHRRAWWSVGLREPAPLLATYMARRPPAFVHNRAEARHINIAHGLYPRAPLSAKALERLARVLRDTISVQQGRTYAGGLTKFEPKEMERLLVPDVTQETVAA